MKVDCDRPVYFGPFGNVDRRVDVGVKSGTTVPAGEQALRLPVGLCNMAADVALPAGISRVNKDHRNPSQFRLVADKSIQLKESPISKALSIGPSEPCPRGYAPELFKGYSPFRVFGCRDNFLGNTVVDVALKSRLPVADFFEMALGRLGAALLKGLFNLCRALSYRVDLRAGECVSVARGGNVDDSLVYAEIARWLNGRPIGKLYHDAKKKLAPLIDEVGFALPFSAFEGLVVAEHHRNFVPPVHRVNAGGRQIREGKQTRVIYHSRILLERVLLLLVGFVGFFDLLEGTDHELRAKGWKRRPNLPIQSVVHLESGKTLLPKGILRNIVARRVERLKGFMQRLGLLAIRKQLHLYGQIHRKRMAHILSVVNPLLKESGRFSLEQAHRVSALQGE